jgi:nitrogen fixation/metabolism regulation signal transduction histidine kinase
MGLLALSTGLPGLLLASYLLWDKDFSARTRWTLLGLALLAWWWLASLLRDRVISPLQTIANFLSALREGDFSLRAHTVSRNDALGEVFREINALGSTLQEQRLGAQEAIALLRAVMAEIDVSIFTFDAEKRLKLINRAGEKLLSAPAERLLEKTAEELGLGECLEGENKRTVPMTFPGGTGRWEIRRGHFREHGRPHELLVLADLSRPLREEERQAWQRLIRVLGHELNNSLTPIKSMAGSMETMMRRDSFPEDWKEDMQRGLSIIASRAESLSRFMEGYAKLARLPRPKFQPIVVADWIQRAARLEVRLPVEVAPGPQVSIRADGDQLDQLLINLVRNAVDAALPSRGKVCLRWQKKGDSLEVLVEDEGPGIANPSNLFVPFFTTKPGGSGIGLALCRQIAEGHDGTLTLENRQQGTGCLARLQLPLDTDRSVGMPVCPISK